MRTENFMIVEDVIDGNPVVWAQSIQSANGDIDTIEVRCSHLRDAQVGTSWVCVGGGSMWSSVWELKVVFKDDKHIVCLESYGYRCEGEDKVVEDRLVGYSL